jgi:hypothetical protein
MAEPPVSAIDAAIRPLVANGPWPTAAIAARLAIPERVAASALWGFGNAGGWKPRPPS